MVQVTTTLLQQVMECIPAKKDRFSNLQVLMDENEELPPSGFLSASIWFPSGPSDGFVFVKKYDHRILSLEEKWIIVEDSTLHQTSLLASLPHWPAVS